MRRYAALSGGGLFALLLLTSTVTLAAPPVSAQVPETVTGLVYKTNSIETEIVTIDKFGGITGDDDSYPFEAFVDQSGWIYYVYDAHDPATVTGMYNDEMRTFQECNDAWCHVVGDDGNLYKVTVPAFDVGVTSPIDRGEFPKIEQTASTYKLPDGSYQMFQHYPYVKYGGEWIPYILEETDDSVFVRFNDGSLSFDKSECAVTYFNPLEEILIKSETYNVRSATIGTDDWSHLQVNDAVCNVSYYEEEFQIGTPEVLYVNLTKENDEGVYRIEYHISMGQVKTTAYFENLSLDNSKIAFTQSVSFDDPIITLNDTEYDLSQLRGQNFPREILEENEDLFIEARELYFNAGLGFEHLWNVNISDTVPLDKHQVNLDYANQGETQIAIGETQELDPMYHFGNQGWPVKNWAFQTSNGTGSTCFNGSQGSSIANQNSMIFQGQYNGSYSSTDNSGNPSCIFTIFWYDISKIPDWAEVENVQFRHYGGCYGCPQYNSAAAEGWAGSTKIVSQMHYGHYWGSSSSDRPTWSEAMELVDSGVQGGSYNAQGGLTGGTHEYHQYAQYTPQSGFCYGQVCTAWETIAVNDKGLQDFEQQLRSGNDWFSMMWLPNGNCLRTSATNSGSSGEGGAQCSVSESFPNRLTYASGRALYTGGATMLGVNYYDNQVPAPNAVGSQPLTVSQTQAGSVDLSWYPPPAQNTNGGNNQLGVTLSPAYIVSDGENFGFTNGIFHDGTCNSGAQAGGYCHEAFIHDNVGGVVTQDSHGVGHNVETGVAGVYGNAWRFNGTTSYVSDIFLNIDPDPTTGWSWFGWVALDSNRPVVNTNVGGSSTIWGNPGIGIDVSLDSHHTGRSFNPDVVRAYANGGYSDSAQNKSFPFDDQTYCYTREGTATNTGNNPNNDSNCNSVWHSIAVTKQAGVASTNIYFDGQLVGTHSGNSNVSGNSVQEYYFGATNQFGTPRYTLDGKLDEFAFYSKELTAWEVGQLHAGSHGRVKTHEATHFGGNAMSGQAVYDFPASLIAYYDFEQTGKHTNSGFTDNAVLTNVAIKTDPIRQGATAYSIYNDTDGGGSGLAQGFYGKTQPHVDNLYEYWNFDDGNIAAAIDSGHTPIVRNFISGSDYSNLGGYNAGPTYSVDYGNKKFGTSSLKIYDHTSTTSASSVAVYETKDFNFNFDTPFTVSAWIDARTDISNWWGVLLHKGYNWAGAQGTWSVGINTNGTISCGIDDAGSNTSGNSTTVTNSAVTDLGWTHIACVWTGMGAYSQGSGSQIDGVWKIYINGVHQPVGTGAGTVTEYQATAVGNPYNEGGTGMLVIGDRGDGAGRYTGWVDDLRIYDTAFSDEDVELLYNFSPDNSEQITIDKPVGTTVTFLASEGGGDDWYMYGPSGAGTNCGAPSAWNESGNNGGYLKLPGTSVTNSGCIVSFSDFDVSSIPSNATITDVDFEYRINSNVNINNYMSCSWTPVHEYSYSQTAAFGTPDETVNAMLSNTPYLIADAGCNTSVGDVHHVDFGDQAVSDLQQMVGQSGNAAMFTIAAKPASDNDHERMTDFPFTADDLNWRMTNNGSGWSTNNPGGESVEKTLKNRELHVTYTVPTDVLTTGGTYAFKIATETPFGNSSQYYWTDGTVGSTQGEVRALTHEGHDSGAYSNIVTHTMIGAPGAPTNLAAVTGMPIDSTWTAPASNGGSAITDYEMFRDGTSIGTVGSTATAYSDSAIVGGNTYTYEVAAVNALGTGPKSNQSTATAGTAPGAPTGVVATAVPNQINLVWVTPGDDGGVAITGYKVYRSDNLVSPIVTLGVVNAWNGDTTGTLGVSYTYNVHAVNSIGDSAAGTSNAAVFGDVPAKVVISLVQALAGLAVKIDWAEPASNGYGITTYLVEYTIDSGSNWNTVGTTANLTLNHSSLTEGTAYQYRVSATNALGTGVVSDTSSSVIAGDVPDAPSGHSATAQTGNEIDLAWTEPDDHEYSIDEYRIYRSLTSGGTYTLLVDGLTGLTHTDSSLADGQDYYYKIQAHNSLGWSADSSIVSATAGDIPDQVTGLTSTAVAGSLVDLAWNAAGDNGLTISAYTVEVSTDNTNWSTLATLGNVTSYQATYTASDNGSTKYWRVSATNSLGTGAVSTSTNTIIGDVPGQITGLTATAQSASEIDLSWNVPADNGYAITVYKIEQSLDNSNWTTLTSNHATTTYSDTGLTASTDYYYKVSGNNALGIGAASSSVQEKTFGVPNDITDLALSVQSTTQINLSWTAPNLNGYTLVDYEVFQSEDGTTWTSITEQTGTTLNVTGLNVNDVYYFKVTTENTYGTSGDSNIENAPTLPLPPATVTPTTISDTEITITWNQPVGDQQSGYKIERSTDDTNYSIIVADTGNTNTSYADTGLTPLTTYYYKVSTINASGTSAASSSSFTETYGAPDAPTNLVATSLTQAHIKLDWVAPGDNNGAAVSGYKIERGTDGTNFSVLVADTATTAVTYTDTTGTAGTTYYYRISSINTYGTGVPSNVDSALSTDVPAQVTGLSATAQPNFEIDLAWTAPSDGGSAITGYKIERSLDNTTWSDLVPTTGNQNVTYTDINLASGQDYYYRVSAINLVGAGTASSVATNQAGDIPDTVTVLSATAQAGSEIVVTWTAPSDNDYAITSYTVERSTDQTTWTTAGGGASTTFTDTGLTDGTTYYYRVFSTNALGNSATSSVVNDLAGDKPDQTTGLTGVALNETQIKLDWTAPGDNAYSITGYKIEVSPDNATWTTVVADTQTNAVTYTHTGLTTVTTYYHKVSAINALGTGNASSSVQTTTMGVPDAITTLSGTAAINSINDARSDITLTWTAPTNNGSAISHYNVQVLSVSDGVTWLTLANNVTGTSTLHSNALGDTQFSYRVFAINAIGISNASNTAQVWSLPTVPLGTAATATSDTTISVSWTELTNGTTYRIEHSTDNVTWSSESNPATSTYGDTGLTIDTLHYYRVFAINPSGESPSSPATSATTFSYPDPPTNLTATPTPTNLLEVNLAWNHPADTGGDAILNYIVERSPDGTSWSSLPSNCPPATDCDYNYFVDGVAQSNTYYYRVIGENSVGMDVVNGYSNIVTYTSPTPAFAPSNLSVEPVGTNNDAATISWTAPTNTGTHAITGYKVERAINSGSWTTAIETTNTNTAVQDSNLIVGNNYQYRVFTITFAGYSTSPSNMDSIEMLDITFTINGSTLGGNTIAIQPDILFSDGSHAPTVTEIRLFENSGFDNNNTNTPETLQQNITWGADIMYAYPNEESTYFAIATLDNGAITTWTSNSVTLTPASPFSGDLQFTEIRDATSNWGTSELNLEIQPAGSDVIIKYQEEGNVGYDTSTGICINNCPVITGWSNVQQAITSTTANLDPDKTYYISVYVQPTFEYPPIVVDGDPVAMTCTSSSSPDCQDGNIPKAYPSDIAIKSAASIYAPPSLGIDQLGNLFGMPLVFVFVVGLAAVFTGRSAQMGIIFLAATLGIMAYLGYLSFDFGATGDNSNMVTWTLVIVVAILGVFIGKRWS